MHLINQFHGYLIIIGEGGVNLGYRNSERNVAAVLKQMEEEENLFLDGRTFKDVPTSSEYYPAIEALINRGAISDSNYLFRPYSPVTRGQASKMIVKGLQLSITHDADLNFVDVEPNHEYYDYIATLKSNQIIRGISSTEFGINQPLTRGQMTLILSRILKLPESDNS